MPGSKIKDNENVESNAESCISGLKKLKISKSSKKFSKHANIKNIQISRENKGKLISELKGIINETILEKTSLLEFGITICEILDRPGMNYFNLLLEVSDILLKAPKTKNRYINTAMFDIKEIMTNWAIDISCKENFTRNLVDHLTLRKLAIDYETLLVFIFYINHQEKKMLPILKDKIRSYNLLVMYGVELLNIFRHFFNYENLKNRMSELLEPIIQKTPSKLINLLKLNKIFYGNIAIDEELLIYILILYNIPITAGDIGNFISKEHVETLIKVSAKLTAISLMCNNEVVRSEFEKQNPNFQVIFKWKKVTGFNIISFSSNLLTELKENERMYHATFMKTVRQKVYEYIVSTKSQEGDNKIERILEYNHYSNRDMRPWYHLLKRLKDENLHGLLAYWCDKLRVRVEDNGTIVTKYNEDIPYMNLNIFGAKIIVLKSCYELKMHLEEIFSVGVVGLDVEWDSYKRGSVTTPSIIQLAKHSNIVYIIDVIKLQERGVRYNILRKFGDYITGNHGNAIIIGYEIAGDVNVMNNLFRAYGVPIDCTKNRIIDLAYLYNNLLESKEVWQYFSKDYDPANELRGLDRLVYRMTGLRLQKQFQRYRWNKRPLPTDCLNYAACDAYSLIKIYDAIEPLLLKEGIIFQAEDRLTPRS